ncbi:multiple cyclophane-containing RiPP AmcA [Streptomyces sp. NPDC002454]|uniref:multiple cyclophane-containing RiPP AmcA n=1 Tax=Streptomyces sp. NPDC002490 TaxID=3154416 RepID=UPI0033295401
MTLLEQLTTSHAPVVVDLISAHCELAPKVTEASWDNRPTWDNWKKSPAPFDNRPTWDNWQKK